MAWQSVRECCRFLVSVVQLIFSFQVFIIACLSLAAGEPQYLSYPFMRALHPTAYQTKHTPEEADCHVVQEPINTIECRPYHDIICNDVEVGRALQRPIGIVSW